MVEASLLYMLEELNKPFYRLTSMVELNSQVQNIPFEVIKKSLQLVIDVIIHIENIDE